MASEADPFDQAHDHPYMRQHWRADQTRLVEHCLFLPSFDRHGRWVAGGRLGWRLPRIEIALGRHGRRNVTAVAAAIEPLLLRLPGCRLVVGGTPLAGSPPPMVLAAAKGTTQVPPTCVAGMRQKANPAVRAVGNAALKLGMGLQHRVQRGLIMPDKRPGAIVLMPIRAKREKLLDGDGKKARLSAILSIVLCTPSSYLFDANASRGRARFFVRDGQEPGETVRTNHPLPTASPAPSVCRAGADSSRARSRKHYSERRNPSSSFQVVRQFT